VRVQHFAQVHRGFRIPLHRIVEAQVQAPHVRVFAGGVHPNSDDRILRARRHFGTVPVEVI